MKVEKGLKSCCEIVLTMRPYVTMHPEF